ncbi:hypothetical protein H312_01230 [Anncaliia algerae PRA339]|uniref:KRR-R motif-containing protein 1 n=1 Tax=Anncaliia algerae PRA339 TaxID=1288291 RepID=A0A059F2W5_9MICR|nr:hypothetical protein H312_01230 [Anncaliia algerae PRA339]
MSCEDEQLYKYNESDFKHAFLEKSEFTILYPEWRNEYIVKNKEPMMELLKYQKIDCIVKLKERSITISTNENTRDPYVILKANDFVRLVCRGVPLKEANEIFKDDMFCDIIKLDKQGFSKEITEKRKKRLEGDALESLSMLTKCFIVMHKGTLSCIGPYKGVEEVRSIALDTIKNIHPVYNLKILMEKRKLEKNPEMKNEDWDRFLPKIKKINKKSKNPKKKNKENTKDKGKEEKVSKEE